jgi:hypothetical protein
LPGSVLRLFSPSLISACFQIKIDSRGLLRLHHHSTRKRLKSSHPHSQFVAPGNQSKDKFTFGVGHLSITAQGLTVSLQLDRRLSNRSSIRSADLPANFTKAVRQLFLHSRSKRRDDNLIQLEVDLFGFARSQSNHLHRSHIAGPINQDSI